MKTTTTIQMIRYHREWAWAFGLCTYITCLHEYVAVPTAMHEDSRWRTQAAAQGPTDEDKQQLILDFLLETNAIFPDPVNQPSSDTAWAFLQVARSCPCPCACLPQASCHRRCALALAMQKYHLNLNSALDAFCEHRNQVI